MNIGTETWKVIKPKSIWQRLILRVCPARTAFVLTGSIFLITPLLDPPIKHLVQRHIYLGTDAIAVRDLGFAMARWAIGRWFGGQTA